MQKMAEIHIYLCGESSKIPYTLLRKIKMNIRIVAQSLGYKYKFMPEPDCGLVELRKNLNLPNTIYILNDSMPYHLCNDAPVILLCNDSSILISSPKPNTIGTITHYMAAYYPLEIASCLHRMTPMRQHSDRYAAHTYILVAEAPAKNSDEEYRYSMAAASRARLAMHDYNTKLCTYKTDTLPKVNEILKEGISLFQHPDDLLVFANTDIIFTPGFSANIRCYMDNRPEIDSCFLSRVDVGSIDSFLLDTDLHTDGLKDFEGSDVYVFRPNAECIKELANIDLYIGRYCWDSVWSNYVGNYCPIRLVYHIAHNSEWLEKKYNDPIVHSQNLHNHTVCSQLGNFKLFESSNAYWPSWLD
jgi:hypothetical protein